MTIGKYKDLKMGYLAERTDDEELSAEMIQNDKLSLEEFKEKYAKEIARTSKIYNDALINKNRPIDRTNKESWDKTWESLESDDTFRHYFMKAIDSPMDNVYLFLAPYTQEAKEYVGHGVEPTFCECCGKEIELMSIAPVCPNCGTYWYLDCYFD